MTTQEKSFTLEFKNKFVSHSPLSLSATKYQEKFNFHKNNATKCETSKEDENSGKLINQVNI